MSTSTPADQLIGADPEPIRPEGRTEWSLESILANRRWVRRTEPFPHVVAQNVFVEQFYAELDDEFRRIEVEHPEAFQRNMTGYDASAADLENFRDGPLGVFVSREWHDLVSAVAGVTTTGDVSGGLHHHEPGSASGWPHNDLNPGWFGDPPAGEHGIRLPSHGVIEYQKGTRAPDVEARETIRAVSLLFYLGNPEWTPGDGGETGLFSSYDSAHLGPRAAAAPLNNSLVMFECTAFSLHAFLSNRVKPRNSAIMWLHRTKDEVLARWGEQSIVTW
ncbi:MAG: 2-oxo acid dehydrogenase [Pseudonocardiales bacterium]|nr:MAG: 2-oxo acid dehydrogenase [Pseudonocardiales bacterium]